MTATDAFLIIGHPGHELAVHHWLETARPRVFVLTDGSGLQGKPRLEPCRACLSAAGAEPGGVFGPLSDRGWYRALLAADPGPLAASARAILEDAAERAPGLIVSDAMEGQEPLHDLACAVADAVAAALERSGHAVERRTFPVSGPIRRDEPLLELRLDAAASARKWAAARAYAGMEDEIEGRLAEPGFRMDREPFHRPAPEPPALWRPAYEQVGREGVALGRHAEAIEYARHVRPVIRRLRSALAERTAEAVS